MPDFYEVHSPYRCEFDPGRVRLNEVSFTIWGNTTAFVQIADPDK